jgi:ubiquitin carboxyl-terminal hydrolase 48
MIRLTFRRNIFVQMECGPRSSVDPESLISALRLDSSVQQDGQEFMKLFLTLLERSFEGIQEMQGKISKMFRGHLGYQTRCLVCNQLSGGSHRFDEFSELDIPIKGYTSLRDSLDSLLAPEVLDGDNQYFCDTCNCKQDATRQLIVKDLPPFLCLSLQRFVFDLKVGICILTIIRLVLLTLFLFPTENG